MPRSIKAQPKSSRPPPQPPKPLAVSPHVVKELIDLREKAGKLEGMMESLLKPQ